MKRAALVTLFALLDIWLVAPHSPTTAWILGAIIAVLLLLFTRPSADLGFGWSNLIAALKAWWSAYILCSVALAVLAQWMSAPTAALASGVAYLAECVVQQFVYQYLVCDPLRADLGPTSKSDWIAALLFSLVHLPNPILVPATLLWGFAASRLFRQHRSLWAIAILQYLLSGILYALLPHSLQHPFRIGPRYFAH